LHSITQNPIDVWRRLMTRVTARYDEIGLRAADAIMVENPWMLDYARAATRDLRTVVRYAPPGVDAALFNPAADRTAALAGEPYVLAVGRFGDPRKNGALLLEAFARTLRQVEQPLKLMVAGADDPGDAFRTKARALRVDDRVIIRAKLSDRELAAAYRRAACLALSSNEEGLGMVVLEAMASGIPVVATRCGGPDGIITDGENGFLVAVGDAEAMADRLALVINDSRINVRIGEKARETIEAGYAEEFAGSAFLDLYRSLLHTPEKACVA
jgi:glycosyltransferase involved in cell wall biosynthesis